jgi:hypothetical protein
MAAAMGIELFTEEQYRDLQELGEFDQKTSSWVLTLLLSGNAVAPSFVTGATARSSCTTTERNLIMPPVHSAAG